MATGVSAFLASLSKADRPLAAPIETFTKSCQSVGSWWRSLLLLAGDKKATVRPSATFPAGLRDQTRSANFVPNSHDRLPARGKFRAKAEMLAPLFNSCCLRVPSRRGGRPSFSFCPCPFQPWSEAGHARQSPAVEAERL